MKSQIILFTLIICTLQQNHLKASLSSVDEDCISYEDYPELTTEFKIKKKKITGQLYAKAKPYSKHLLKPQHAMSFEVDSALVGIIHGHDTKATVLTGVASIFALSSCVFGLSNIFYALTSINRAKEIQSTLEEKISRTKDKLKTYPSNDIRTDKIFDELLFYTELQEKIRIYLKKEVESNALNSLIAIGTFFEFLGFLSSEAFLGHSSKYPQFSIYSNYFLSVGLTVVSLSSLIESLSEIKNLVNIYTSYSPRIEEDIASVDNTITKSILDHNIAEELKLKVLSFHNKSTTDSISVNELIPFLKNIYTKELRSRINKLRSFSLFKFFGQGLIGVGTGLFAFNKIFEIIYDDRYFSGISEISIGALTGLGVLLGSLSYYYNHKYTSTPLGIDNLDLHEDKFEILRSEIFSLLIKLEIPFPKDKNFENLRQYFFKLAPIEDLSKRQGSVDQVPFYDKYFVHPNSPINNLFKLLYKVQRKDLLHLISTKVLNSYLEENKLESINPFITLNSENNEGSINWKKIIFYYYKPEMIDNNSELQEQAKFFLEKTFLYGSDILKEHLSQQLRLTISMLMRQSKI